MLSNEEMNDLLAGFDKRMEGINAHYIRLMAEHIRDIGQLTASDVDRLEAMRRCSRDMNVVQREIREAANLSDKELEEIFTRTIESGIDFLGTVLGKGTISLENNYGLRKLLAAQIQQTRGALQNFSNTTVVSKPYQNAVDKAIQAVQSGMTDYRSAIRSTVRQTASEGLRVLQTEQEDNRRLGEASPLVMYQSGITRRLDTAARQNILDGVRQLSQQSMDLIGSELGADGVEISAHMLCAEDHVDYQGEQFTNAEFDELQRTLRRPFGEWNCRHMWWPVFIGISRPTHTREELEQYKNYSREQITIIADDGREITRSRYEWTQEQRRLETAIRYNEDVRTAAFISGDSTLYRQCRVRGERMRNAYEYISSEAGLYEDTGRMTGSTTHMRRIRGSALDGGYGNAIGGISDFSDRTNMKYILDNAPANEKKLWELCQGEMHEPRFGDGITSRLSAYYDPNDHHVHFLNETIAYRKSRHAEEGSTYFHEYGHNIDFILGKRKYGKTRSYSSQYENGLLQKTVTKECHSVYRGWIKGAKGIDVENESMYNLIERIHANNVAMARESIVSDILNLSGITNPRKRTDIRDDLMSNWHDSDYVSNILGGIITPKIREKCIIDAFYTKELGNEFMDAFKARYDIYQRTDVSDMFGPFAFKYFGESRPFDIGHDAEYAKTGDHATETFAEIYSAHITQNQSLPVIKELFPETVNVYLQMIKKVIQ